MSVSAQIQYIAKRLGESEQLLILELMKKLLPDDVANAEDVRDILNAREELINGEAIDFTDINWT